MGYVLEIDTLLKLPESFKTDNLKVGDVFTPEESDVFSRSFIRGRAKLQVDVECSKGHRYGSEQLGPHVDVKVVGQDIQAGSKKDYQGGYLYMANLTRGQGYKVIAYSGGKNISFLMHGEANSIRGQGRVEFDQGERVGVIVRRGNYTEQLPQDTELVAEREVVLNCS